MSSTPSNAPSGTPDPDLAGREFGNYRLLHRLGRGGMAEVYLAEQPSLRRQVAIKVLKANLAGDPNYVRRFIYEAQAAAALVHANIVQIHEVGCVNGVHFIAQEYVAGQNLRQFMTRCPCLPAARTVSLLRQVAAALGNAAEKGIVHRDIKPENILLTARGEVKVADFGLARVAGEAVHLTQVGITMGTPLYMSPEQVEGKTLDHRSDLYSLGVTAYHMLAGRPPFEGETALAVAVQHLQSKPLPLADLRPDLPAALCEIVHRLLAKSPDERYASAAELLRDLRAFPVAEGDETWTSSLELPLPLGEITAGRNLEVTQRLGQLMRATEPQASRGSHWWKLMAAAAAAFLAGSMLARANKPQSLLAIAPSERPQVKRLESAEAQLYYALSLNTPSAYASVAEYFPESTYQVLRAKQRQAELYLAREDFPAALAIYDEFVNKLDRAEEQFRLLGFAGKAIVAFRQHDYAHAAEHLARLVGKEQDLERVAPETLREIERIRPLNLEQLRATGGM